MRLAITLEIVEIITGQSRHYRYDPGRRNSLALDNHDPTRRMQSQQIVLTRMGWEKVAMNGEIEKEDEKEDDG